MSYDCQEIVQAGQTLTTGLHITHEGAIPMRVSVEDKSTLGLLNGLLFVV